MIVPGVERILVLRPNALGDFVFALPALHALRAAYPRARITLLGKGWHQRFLRGRPGPIDEVIAMPCVRGVGAPMDAPDEDADEVEAFVAALRARRFDLAFQMYGGGRHSNPFVAGLGARLTVGLRSPDAPPLDRWLPYRPLQNERLRLLELVALVGAGVTTLEPRLAVTAADREELAQALPPALLSGQPWVVLQPGATDPRRRWPAASFARLGDALASGGAQVALNGSADERDLLLDVLSRMRQPAFDLSGRLSIGGLAALLERAALLVSNDTGPLHLAQSVGCATVGIYWFSNLLVSAPPFQARHTHALSTRLDCPVCGRCNLHERCPHDASFVADVSVDEVLGLAREALSSPLEAAAGPVRQAACGRASSSPA